jgi:hypothetical protein
MNRSMMMTTNVDSILDEIAALSLEDQELVDEIMHKRIIEGRREEIRADYIAALEERSHGRTRTGSVSDLFGSL